MTTVPVPPSKLEESLPLKEASEAWTIKEKRLLISNTLMIAGVVSGSYILDPLYNSLEADANLDWTPETTQLCTTITVGAEALGLFMFGPLADTFPASLLLNTNAVGVSVGLIVMATSPYASLVVATGFSVCLMKGLLWPSVGAIIAANLSTTKRDVAFLAGALGSRTAMWASEFTIGGLLTRGYSWRDGLFVWLIALCNLCVVSYMTRPTDIVQPHTLARDPERHDENWFLSYVMKIRQIVLEANGWFAWFTLAASGCIWAMFSYLAVLLRTSYGVSDGQAAMGSSMLVSGCIGGMVAGALVSNQFGARYGRWIHVAFSCTSIVGFAVLTLTRVPWPVLLMLLSAGGFGLVMTMYLPVFSYAASSAPSERAFRMAMLDGTAMATSMLFTFCFGFEKFNTASSDSQVFGISAACCVVGTCSMAALYWRLDGEVSCEQQPLANQPVANLYDSQLTNQYDSQLSALEAQKKT